ncbi:TIGR00282 family metallophosphoesterase [Chlorobium phaeovibrioides]|uniref:TIGR00282 family metallophosphoesterase n=2 Tax=Chlorobium phaeovibrioides TaxID=1094 RepID=A0A3S0L208_CHLPH|nr:TIGR00282 family metallophosphoesterase [Chlorobium phaeovibrioides]HCD36275.1 TIGR00282 family metallophosphoesterase [Chlorobium sp.]KAA6232162.1 TIGR00282 family metallophosphoesterase [Chlorobium phaeovibrioides]MWV54737.1 TIGR00282 family metallophosphoesterase [Chlorobium phaeovibrioides]QEQ57317.1 TIGR00282 family metallophosphoesterase [Chlorobium phaeovibrioides]RTY34868.1 TIGR00282 family metallophosphoesterase [Chlorobium phaeovibrioides]
MGQKTLRVLFIGDVVGTPGLQIVGRMLKSFISSHHIDFVVCNGENAHNGKGMSVDALNQLLEAGVNVVTGGNHTWSNFNFFDTLKTHPQVLRPLNYPKGTYGKGYGIYRLPEGLGDIAIINLQGRTFMSPIDCPFRTADWVIKQVKDQARFIFVDFHAEATAEKIALGWYLDGRVSALIGTHTHVQTADERILPKGTAYCTDAGMTGPHQSVIGMQIKSATDRMLYQTPHKYECAVDDVHMSGIIMAFDAATGKATGIERLFYPPFERGSL